MPLLDQFHPPLSVQRHWHSFHNAWAANLAAGLNETPAIPGEMAEIDQRLAQKDP